MMLDKRGVDRRRTSETWRRAVGYSARMWLVREREISGISSTHTPRRDLGDGHSTCSLVQRLTASATPNKELAARPCLSSSIQLSSHPAREKATLLSSPFSSLGSSTETRDRQREEQGARGSVQHRALLISRRARSSRELYQCGAQWLLPVPSWLSWPSSWPRRRACRRPSLSPRRERPSPSATATRSCSATPTSRSTGTASACTSPSTSEQAPGSRRGARTSTASSAPASSCPPTTPQASSSPSTCRTGTCTSGRTTSWTSSSWGTCGAGSGGCRPTCTATAARRPAGRSATASGSTPRRTSTATPSSGAATGSYSTSTRRRSGRWCGRTPWARSSRPSPCRCTPPSGTAPAGPPRAAATRWTTSTRPTSPSSPTSSFAAARPSAPPRRARRRPTTTAHTAAPPRCRRRGGRRWRRSGRGT